MKLSVNQWGEWSFGKLVSHWLKSVRIGSRMLKNLDQNSSEYKQFLCSEQLRKAYCFIQLQTNFNGSSLTKPNIWRCKLMLNFSILVKTETQAAVSATVTEIFPILKQVICTLLLIFCFIFYIFLCKKLSIVDY